MNNTQFNFNNPETYNHRYVQVKDKKYHYVEQGPKNAPLILLLHGFPESWYSWKYQIEHLSNKLGYHVVAFDMPGYGETKVEDKLENYTLKSVVQDIHYIFTQHFKQDKVFVIAHDWGSFVGWELAYLYPDSILGYISISIPYLPNLHPPMTERQKAEFKPILGYMDLNLPMTERQKAEFSPYLGYVVALNEGNVAEFDSDIEKFLKCFYVMNTKQVNIKQLFVPLDKGLFEHSDSFDKSKNEYPKDNIQGTKGPTNWYRTSYLNGLNDQQKSHFNIYVKCLQILGTEEIVPFLDKVKDLLKDTKTKNVEGGHWIHFTNYEKVNALIENFLNQFQ